MSPPQAASHVEARAQAQRRPRLVEVPLSAPRNGERRWTLARLTLDLTALAAAAVYAHAAYPAVAAGWSVVAALATLVALAAAGSYARTLRPEFLRELRGVVSATAIAGMPVAATGVIWANEPGVGAQVAQQWALAALGLAVGRLGITRLEASLRRRGQELRPTLIIGAGVIGHLTAQRLIDNPELGMAPVGFLDKEPLDAPEDGPDLPVFGASWDLERVIRDHGVETAVIAFSTAPHHVLLGIVHRCWQLGLDVLVVPRLFEVEGERVRPEHLGGLPLVALSPSHPRGLAMRLKYAGEQLTAIILLVALAPLLAAIALAVLATSGRPVLYRAPRVGRDGHVFEMLKFRTMEGSPETGGEADADWAAHALDGSPGADSGPSPAHHEDDDEDRRTSVGRLLRRFSLDELPQLWNVARGDMALVGPRPERAHYVERFQQSVYRYGDRHRVKSGITGWAQVNGLRGQTSLADRVEWDNFYVENWSPWLDAKIVAMTATSLFKGSGE